MWFRGSLRKGLVAWHEHLCPGFVGPSSVPRGSGARRQDPATRTGRTAAPACQRTASLVASFEEGVEGMGRFSQTNRRLWDELATIHATLDSYGVRRVLSGASTLRTIELQELGDISGMRVLHVQCHIGVDTVSLARLGASRVVGVDFSPKAVAAARQLAAATGLPVTFECCDVYDMHSVLDTRFDLVFASYGVLPWLSDLRSWAKTIGHLLEPDGVFYLIDNHPICHALVEHHCAQGTVLTFDEHYFPADRPQRCPTKGSYADRNATVNTKYNYQWSHTLSDVMNAVIEAGLRVGFVHEFPVLSYRKFASMAVDSAGWWHLPKGSPDIPLTFSLRATKPMHVQ